MNFMILNKQELFSKGNISNGDCVSIGNGDMLKKYKTIVHNLIQSFLMIINIFIQTEDILTYSTNNVNYLYFKRKINQKLMKSQQKQPLNLQ